jgi:hypothetical protein
VPTVSSTPQPTAAADAIVTYEGRTFRLARGGFLRFGRGSEYEVVLPNDFHLSRFAGSVTVLGDCLLIRNHSSTKPLLLRPPVGEDSVVEPGAAMASLPHDRLQILLVGAAGRISTLHLDVTAMSPPHGPGAYNARGACREQKTLTVPFTLTEPQKRVVRALCAPMISGRGAGAAPATYQEIGEALQLSPRYVRNIIQALRETLTGHGVPDLVSDDLTRPGCDFRWSLARFAIRNGWTHDPDDPPCSAPAPAK